MVVDEEQSVGHRTPVVIDDEKVADARRQFTGIDADGGVSLAVRSEPLEHLQLTSRQHHSCIVHISRYTAKGDRSCDVIVIRFDTQGTTGLLGLRQVYVVVLVGIVEVSLQPSVLRHVNRKDAAPFVLSLDGLAAHFSRNIDLFTQFVDSLEGHIRLGACYQVSALWVEVYYQVGLQFLIESGLRAFHNVFHRVFSHLLGGLIDGHHAAIDRTVESVEVVGHLPAVEKLARTVVRGMLRHAEVHHPTGVGPYLVEAGIE